MSMDLTNIKGLEHYFAYHFDTFLFPMLAEQYLLREDLVRAKKVCEIGLEYHPDYIPGLFLQGQTLLAEKEFIKAEKVFKRIIRQDSGHLNAHLKLAEVQVELKRSETTLKRLYNRILEMDGTNEKAMKWLEDIGKKKRKAPTRKKTSKEKKQTPRDELASLPISPQLATFTLVAVLKSQKLYEQAIEVLSLMARKEDADKKRIKEEKEELLQILKSGEKL